jgi:hypothetical protein
MDISRRDLLKFTVAGAGMAGLGIVIGQWQRPIFCPRREACIRGSPNRKFSRTIQETSIEDT